MEKESNAISMQRFIRHTATISSVAVGLLCASIAFGDSPVSLAPPVGGATAVTTDPSVTYNYTAVPENQPLVIQRATFDLGGYQLYDTEGDIIVVPFVDHNLFIMEFACSTDGKMYFVRKGKVPVLYVPRGGYLENATVPGARWYPFNANFAPTQPVSMSIAPDYDDYVDMGWYAGTVCDGGYYSSPGNGGSSGHNPCPGYGITANGHKCKSWKTYCAYWTFDKPPYHCGYSQVDHHPVLQWQEDKLPPGSRHPWISERGSTGPANRSTSPIGESFGSHPVAGVPRLPGTEAPRRETSPSVREFTDHSRDTNASAPALEDHSRDRKPDAPVLEEHQRQVTPPTPVVEDHLHDTTPAAPVFEDRSRDGAPAEPVVDNHPRDAAPQAPVFEDHSRDAAPQAPVFEDHSRDVTPPAPAADDHARDVTPTAPVFEDHSRDAGPPAPAPVYVPAPAPEIRVPDTPAPPTPVVQEAPRAPDTVVQEAPAPTPAPQAVTAPDPPAPAPAMPAPAFDPGPAGGEHGFEGRR